MVFNNIYMRITLKVDEESAEMQQKTQQANTGTQGKIHHQAAKTTKQSVQNRTVRRKSFVTCSSTSATAAMKCARVQDRVNIFCRKGNDNRK